MSLQKDRANILQILSDCLQDCKICQIVVTQEWILRKFCRVIWGPKRRTSLVGGYDVFPNVGPIFHLHNAFSVG